MDLLHAAGIPINVVDARDYRLLSQALNSISRRSSFISPPSHTLISRIKTLTRLSITVCARRNSR